MPLNESRMPDLELKEGQTFHNGRYRLLRKLGQGGMGAVWLAVDENMGEQVALKFLPPEIQFDPSALDDMRKETARSRKLAHPNIIRIHDMHEYPGEPPFISMEYVNGTSLSGLKTTQAKRCFPWDFLKGVIQQLCEALEYAHDQRVVHRDLKPSNVMFDEQHRVKLADFGIAAVACDSMSRASMQNNTSGTPAYMSPQQMDGRSPRVTDDIYALGAMIYELFTSKPPFFRGDIPHQVRNIDPPTIEERLDEFGLKNPIPADVSAMIMACLSKDPDNRPQSVRAMASWIGFAEDAPPLEETLGEVFAGKTEMDASPSSNELTVLTPDEPTEMEAPVESQPPSAELSDEPELEPSSPTAVRRRSWKLIAGITLGVFLVLAIASMKKKNKQSGRQPGTLTNLPEQKGFKGKLVDPERPAKAPWIGGKPVLERLPGFMELHRPHLADTLENCTVVVLNEEPGEKQLRRSIKPWRSGNPFWSIDGNVITCNLRNRHDGALKTYLVFNSLDLDNFMLAFVYKGDEVSPDRGNYGLFYRCRQLGDPVLGSWFMDGYGIVLGDNSGQLFGVPKDAFSSEARDAASLPPRAREFMGQAKRSRLLQDGGHTCTIRLDGLSINHMVDQRVGRNFRINTDAGKPTSGTLALEVWLRGEGELNVSWEGLFIRQGRMGKIGKIGRKKF